jgi:hypothetical protein
MENQSQFRRTEDAHNLFEECLRCGEVLIFTAKATPAEISKAKANHECKKTNPATVAVGQAA